MERPKSTWQPSPNFTPKDPGRAVTCVVIHATATPGVESPLEWLTNPASKVSAHYLIDRLGMIYHLVHEQNVAWHAGISEWQGQIDVNDFSVGIELVNSNDGVMPYPQEQLDACADMVVAICGDHSIDFKNVVGHNDIAPGRKNDPLGFPWDQFRVMILARDVKN